MKKLLLLSLLFTQPSFAEMMCEDATDYFAVYEPYSYTCNSGQYLPANTLGCVSCPSGFSCNGGTFDFNPDYFQGLSFESVPNNTMNNICADNFPVDLHAIYEPNQYTCSPGYYLPTNVDECTKCSADNYCSGGTYTFNETTDQGITPCPSEHPFAPAGMWTATQCGRILHIGDNIIYLHQSPAHPTEHRLYVNVNGNIYSANMTLLDTPMNILTEQKLKVSFENNVYSVFDDSMETNR